MSGTIKVPLPDVELIAAGGVVPASRDQGAGGKQPDAGATAVTVPLRAAAGLIRDGQRSGTRRRTRLVFARHQQAAARIHTVATLGSGAILHRQVSKMTLKPQKGALPE